MVSWTEDYYMLNGDPKKPTVAGTIEEFLCELKRKRDQLTIKRVSKLSTDSLQKVADSKPMQKLGVKRKKETTFNTGTRMITLTKEDE